MNVHIQYFASLAEKAGLKKEIIETAAKDGRELYEELKKRHGFDLDASLVKLAVDEEFVSIDTKLRDGMVIVIMPPVAGG